METNAIDLMWIAFSSFQRLLLDTRGERRRFSPIVVTAIMLTGCSRLLEWYVVLGDEVHALLGWMRNDAVGVFAAFALDWLHAQRPFHLNSGPAVRREGIGSRHHPAKPRRRSFGDIILNH